MIKLVLKRRLVYRRTKANLRYFLVSFLYKIKPSAYAGLITLSPIEAKLLNNLSPKLLFAIDEKEYSQFKLSRTKNSDELTRLKK